MFVGAVFVADSHAQFTAISDDFSNVGNLSGSTPDSGVGTWTNISGSGGLSVSSGVLNIASSGEAAQLNFSSSNLTSGTLYMGFDFTVSSSGTIDTSDSISAIAGFRTGTASGGSNAVSFGDFRPSGSAQTFSNLADTSTSQVVVGLFTGASENAATSSLTAWATPLSRGTTYRAVIGFDLGNDTASLWIDPTSSSSTSITLTNVTSDARGVFFREGASSHGTLGADNLNVSMDFNTAAAIPEPSTYAAIFGSMALAGAIWHRRRKATVAAAPLK